MFPSMVTTATVSDTIQLKQYFLGVPKGPEQTCFHAPRELEAAGQEEILGELHRVRLLPLVLHVGRRPTV